MIIHLLLLRDTTTQSLLKKHVQTLTSSIGAKIENYFKKILKIIEPSTKLFSKNNNVFQLETECLYGESFEIIKIENNLCYGTLLTDRYKGWLNFSDLGELPEPNHRVLSIRTFVNEKNDVKSKTISSLPLGSQTHVVSEVGDWFKIFLGFKHIKFGFVPKKHLIQISRKLLDWVSVAESLVNTPYKWGGRDSIGIDCSSLVQLSLQTAGISIGRNSSEQKIFKKLHLIDLDHTKRGDLIFWDGHVGIITSEKQMIHANAFKMMVSIENIQDVIKQIKKRYEIYRIIY